MIAQHYYLKDIPLSLRDFDLYFDITLNESVIDGLFEYFISLAIDLGVE